MALRTSPSIAIKKPKEEESPGGSCNVDQELCSDRNVTLMRCCGTLAKDQVLVLKML
eukprot:CAMPEP_0203842316 /NCGR_PEP_ID=MMETSP0359-20131031/1917_1 /ASSEMBLY_ACC=CAM_ASM_000338 /TAXON_ID=268821 /ORGANISM="Scrippsiella Hangoei, Strain SHTV-5" /LENGTH=56 /DNA_ID=CAMNT_0050756879 /DNA_START=313 /DNA_END=480 /DNA_ORIENTATION=-